MYSEYIYKVEKTGFAESLSLGMKEKSKTFFNKMYLIIDSFERIFTWHCALNNYMLAIAQNLVDTSVNQTDKTCPHGAYILAL